MQAADLGIVSGVSEAFFEPSGTMDRAMFATVLYKAAGGEDASPESLPFEDIRPEDWYAEAVSWAYDNGVVQGISDTEFAPLSRVTREQAATMMIQYLESQGVFSEAEEPDFTDADQISAYARAPLAKAQDLGILAGYTDGTVGPQNTLTRAEGVTLLMNMLSCLEAA